MAFTYESFCVNKNIGANALIKYWWNWPKGREEMLYSERERNIENKSQGEGEMGAVTQF